MQRRDVLIAMSALWAASGSAVAAGRPSSAKVCLAAAWQDGSGFRVGVLEHEGAGTLRISAAVEVPTRAHGLLRMADDSLLAVARRPGDWLLRWRRDGRAVAWRWIEPRRAFSGHALVSDDGSTIFTTETDLDTGAGLVGVRDAGTLEKRAEWPSLGVDAHALINDVRREHGLIVANGGVPTSPETGRAKLHLERMDSSLVRLDARTGEPAGQWRLDDRRLSLRHLAWGTGDSGAILGVALQAEHDDAAARSDAPVLATFDGQSLCSFTAPVALAGYGGDIAALGRTFAVSCPRARGVALYGSDGTWHGLLPLDDACALVATRRQMWVGGRHAALAWNTGNLVDEPARQASLVREVPDLRLDNHWIAI